MNGLDKLQKELNILRNFMSTMLVFLLILYSGQTIFAADKAKALNQQIKEWEKSGIDFNHTEVIKKIRSYIERMEPATFASLHIEREEKPLGIIVLSFTEEINPQIREDIQALVEQPAEVSFRVVKYTEEELMERQSEIDKAIFEEKTLEKEGISVTHTSTDIIKNKVEIGILPYNDKTMKIVNDHFNENMIRIVAGVQAEPQSKEALTVDEEKASIFTKILGFIRNLFNGS